MKKMAKFLAALLAMMMLISCASATMLSTNYYLAPLSLSVAIPGGFNVLTREIGANDPALDVLGLDQASVVSFMETNQLYLDAINDDVTYEITVAMEANTIDNFKNYSDLVLRQVATTIPEQFESLGIIVTSTDLYKTDEATFIKIYYYTPDEYGNATYTLQYFTVYDYQAINFRIFSYVGELTEADELLIQQVVDSADFGC